MKIFLMFLVIGAFALTLVIAGCNNLRPRASATTSMTSTPPSAATANVIIGADEASCLVLGTVMKKTAMTPVTHNGKIYYLCCTDCIHKFKADPGKYITHPATPTRSMKMDGD